MSFSKDRLQRAYNAPAKQQNKIRAALRKLLNRNLLAVWMTFKENVDEGRDFKKRARGYLSKMLNRRRNAAFNSWAEHTERGGRKMFEEGMTFLMGYDHQTMDGERAVLLLQASRDAGCRLDSLRDRMDEVRIYDEEKPNIIFSFLHLRRKS